ncbi:Mn2+ and Fe2+ transporters of the NRAMP family [Amycolatopsis pretoriensis]|uniref:Mn2+ and Fe2+ transporters of the NRAMP family n=1 Tax=Amycolatopsis pretoriensis TaxID=218821 RepID=A0A1H5RFW6_9PSEU|nr:divalent metal cation transporter [Amycolatopsis pretoriensis]SEF37169.1 Mn2+ and Fe2+ transporters of the NRAMP family [Amycolatopsis pretoriensis]
MKKFLAVTLGILTAIGGFVDIGDLVANSQTGARFGMRLAWVVVVGIVGICVYADMAGRIAAVSGRPVFDLIRERLGPRIALVNLAGSYLVTMLTLGAEIGGVALALHLATSVHYLLWVPVVAVVLWVVLWRTKFETLERVFGLLGLALIVFVVALFTLSVPWPDLLGQIGSGPPSTENWATYGYFAVALFAAAMTPYEVFFFSSGGVEEKWTRKDLGTERVNVFVGFPLGGLLSLAIMACAAVVFEPASVKVDAITQTTLPVGMALGKLGLAVVILGVFAATFGAALETGLSSGYTVAQYFGWEWGKRVAPRRAARFHTVVLVSVALGAALLLTTIDPVQLTEYTLLLSAVVLPLTYLPILVVANDRAYLGDQINGKIRNALGIIYLVVILIAAIAAIPLMIITGAGQ